MLRQRRRLRRHLRQNHQERRSSVGRIADVRRLHRHRTNHGMGKQGHRDQVRLSVENQLTQHKWANCIRGIFVFDDARDASIYSSFSTRHLLPLTDP